MKDIKPGDIVFLKNSKKRLGRITEVAYREDNEMTVKVRWATEDYKLPPKPIIFKDGIFDQHSPYNTSTSGYVITTSGSTVSSTFFGNLGDGSGKRPYQFSNKFSTDSSDFTGNIDDLEVMPAGMAITLYGNK